MRPRTPTGSGVGGTFPPRLRAASFPKGLALALLAGLSLLGCSDDSGGPGELTGTVQTPGPALGGAVLEVVGKGISDFSGTGSTRVFYAPAATEDTYRVVLLSSSSSGPLQFRVSVEDLGAKRPSVSVVNLTSPDNLPVPATADYTVSFTR